MIKRILIALQISVGGMFFNSISAQNYVPGTILLRDNNNVENTWGQRGNSQGANNCTPSFNQHCPPGSHCGHTLVGCGAVAIAQVMWKWQYPQSSSYRTYDWTRMPAQLNNNAIAQGEEIARFLRDCGNAVNMRYWEVDTGIEFIDETLTGSNSFIWDVEDALKNTFNYKGILRHSKSDWDNYGSAWEDLIRSEIRAGRPVFYNGMTNITSGHYVVIDGYDAVDPNLFHVNFGWRGDHNGYYRLNSLRGYNSYQKAIVGFSPTYPQSANENLYDVSYTSVSNKRTETARQNIVLPATNKTLTVENGGDLTMIAGNSIILKPGFRAKAGSKFIAQIDPVYQIDKEIRIINRATVVNPTFINGVNDYFWIETENADSWEFQLFNRHDKQIWATAGSIENRVTNVWNGIDSKEQLTSTDYWYILRVKNSYGRVKEITGHFTLILSVPDCTEAMGVTFTPSNTILTDGSLALTPNGDGVNDEVCFTVNNVARWEANLADRSGRSLYSSGNARGQSSICVTNGRGFPNNNRYLLQINYQGTNGCEKARDYYVHILGSTITRSAVVSDSLLKMMDKEFFLQEEEILTSNAGVPEEIIRDKSYPVLLFPNPSRGIVSIRSENDDVKNIYIYNTLGILVHQVQGIISPQTDVDLSPLPDGIYTFSIEINGELYTHKVILNRK